jgi:hypothetical protein
VIVDSTTTVAVFSKFSMRSPCEARAYHLSANDQPSAKYQLYNNTTPPQHAANLSKSYPIVPIMAPGASKLSKYAAEVAELNEHAAKLRTYMKPNILSYAKNHNLPYHRLRRAYLYKPTRLDRAVPNYRLTDTQDLALERYLDAIDAIGYGIHRDLVTQQAYALLEESYIGPDKAPPPLGTNWARR